METRQLGKSSLRITPIVFGAWAIGGWFWGSTDDATAIEAIQTAIDQGINMIDTAPMYGYGHSESVVGQAIKGRREKVFIATKCGLRWDSDQGVYFFEPDVGVAVYRNLKKDSIIEECERSLRRLDIDCIDLYQCHWPDKTTPLEETMEAMIRLKEQGKIREVGVSNFTVEMIKQSGELVSIASDQPKYNLLNRDIEKNVLPYCRKNNVGVLAYSPLEQGMLTGKVTATRTFDEGDWRAKRPWFQPENRHNVLQALEQIRFLADKYKATLAQLTLSWVITEPGITAAITGIRTPAQVMENTPAAALPLTEEDRTFIRKAFEAVPQPTQTH